jgi:citrate synthase
MTARGLEGVVAAASAVSSIMGTTLTYRGYGIEELAEHATFEETVYLLWTGELPTRTELAGFAHDLRRSRGLPPDLLDHIRGYPRSSRLMDRLRTAVSALELFDAEAGGTSAVENWEKAVRILARFPTLVAALWRIERGQDVLAPRQDLSHAANLLYLLHGRVPSDADARAMDEVLILHADHELNASTFSARVAASTLTDMHAAILAGLCALEGPLHGGAAERVYQLLAEIGDPAGVESWLQDARARRIRVPGFGHRVYRDGDPRARVLKLLAAELARSRDETRWYDMSVRLEEEVSHSLGLLPNVDFYSASVYTYLGIPPELFTPMFALSRAAGWIAHIMEQYADNRLIRPRAEYVGSSYRAYIGLEHR